MLGLDVLIQRRYVAVGVPASTNWAHPVTLIYWSMAQLVLLKVRAGVESLAALLASEVF